MKKILPFLLPLLLIPTINFNAHIHVNFGNQLIINAGQGSHNIGDTYIPSASAF